MTLTLPYDSARFHIKSGDIVFIGDNPGVVANIIQFFTKSTYSHVGIAFWMTTGNVERLMMVEAQGGTRRRVVNMSKYKLDNLDVMEGPRPWDDIVEPSLERLSEVPYGYLEAAYVGLVEFMQQYFNITLPRKNFKGEICSEFVARICKLPSRHVSPQALMDQLIEHQVNPRINVRG